MMKYGVGAQMVLTRVVSRNWRGDESEDGAKGTRDTGNARKLDEGF